MPTLVRIVYFLGVIGLFTWIGVIYYLSVWPAHPEHTLDEWIYCFMSCVVWQIAYDLYKLWLKGKEQDTNCNKSDDKS